MSLKFSKSELEKLNSNNLNLIYTNNKNVYKKLGVTKFSKLKKIEKIENLLKASKEEINLSLVVNDTKKTNKKLSLSQMTMQYFNPKKFDDKLNQLLDISDEVNKKNIYTIIEEKELLTFVDTLPEDMIFKENNKYKKKKDSDFYGVLVLLGEYNMNKQNKKSYLFQQTGKDLVYDEKKHLEVNKILFATVLFPSKTTIINKLIKVFNQRQQELKKMNEVDKEEEKSESEDEKEQLDDDEERSDTDSIKYEDEDE